MDTRLFSIPGTAVVAAALRNPVKLEPCRRRGQSADRSRALGIAISKLLGVLGEVAAGPI